MKITEEQFLKAGFVKDNDPLFQYRKELVPEREVIESGLEEDEIPALLFGTTGINAGFCIYTGEHFVWLNVKSLREAVAIAETITAFEAV